MDSKRSTDTKCVSYRRVSDEWRCQLSVPLSAAQQRAVRSRGTSSPCAGTSSSCTAPYDEIFIIHRHKNPNTHTHTAQAGRMWGTSCNTIQSTGEIGEGGLQTSDRAVRKTLHSQYCLWSTVFTLFRDTEAECKQKQRACGQLRTDAVRSALVKCWFFGRVLLKSPRV